MVKATNQRTARMIPTLAPQITRTLLNLIFQPQEQPFDMIFLILGIYHSFCRDFSEDKVHTNFPRIEQAVLELFGTKGPDRDEQLTESSLAQPPFGHGEKSIHIPSRSQNSSIMLLVTPQILQMSL